MKLILSIFFVCTIIQGYEGTRLNRVSDVIFRFYNGNDLSQFVDENLPNASNIINAPGFNTSAYTVFYIHGYKESADSESTQLVISTYLETFPDSNIILIDWSNMGGGDYFLNAAPHTRTVSAAAAPEIKDMINAGLFLSGIHCVGHSLGAHVCGFIGRRLKGYNMELPRITGLDPSFPSFYPGIILGHILGSDAKFVDVIHTDAGSFGGPCHTGKADFWPNGGDRIQPGCPRVFAPFTEDSRCSHSRSWQFWAESLRNPGTFAAVPYNSWLDFKRHSNLQNKPIAYMGADADHSLSGDFYLQTSGASIFGKGIDGTVYIAE